MERQRAAGLWLAWLLAAQGVIWNAHSAAGPCATGCVVNVEPVCGSDGRSYANSCVATCAEVFVKHLGYCDGEKIVFISPVKPSSSRSSTASTAGQPQPNWRVARESAQIVHTSTINRFIHEGYVYRGRVALSGMPAYLKESSAGSAVAADVTTAQSQQESSSSSSKSLRVAIIRVDNMGHMYGKTFSYDPKRFSTTAYPPFDPSGGSAAAAAPPAPSAAATQNPSNSPSGKASPPSPPTPAPAAIAPPATAGPPISSSTTTRQTPSPAAATASTHASTNGSSSSGGGSNGGSSSSTQEGKSSPAAPAAAAAAPPGQKAAVPAPAVQHAAPASKAPASLPPASQVKAPAPGPALQPPGETPGHGSSGGGGSATSAAKEQQQPNQQQQQTETDTVAAAGSDAGSAAGFSNTPGASTPAAADLFSVVHPAGSGSSTAGGEVLKPELGSYDNSANQQQQEVGTPGPVTAGADVAGGNSSSTGGSHPGPTPSSSEVTSGALPAGTVASHPVVTVQGDESAPGGTVTTVTFANGDEAGERDSAQRQSTPPQGRPQAKAELSCSPEQQVCIDKVTGTSLYYGTKPPASKYMDQVPMVGKGRISGMVLYYNTTSGCLRGTQVMYNYVDHPTSYYTSVLLGSAISKASSIIVKTMMLGQNESIVKAEVYAPKCVQYVKLYTNHNKTVLVGAHGKNATLSTPQRDKPDVMLLAIRGFQDRAISHPATLMNSAYISPGVLKQLQFVWGARVCNCSSSTTAAAPSAAKPAPSAASSIALEAALAGTASSSGRRLAQILHRAAASSSVVLDAEELEQLQQQRRHEWQPQRQLHKLWRRQQMSGAPALAADGLTGDPSAAAATGGEWGQSGVQQLYSPKPPIFGSMLARATLGMDGNLPAYDGPNIHRMLSVITPDSREPCPVLAYPFKTMGQINAKAQDGGFVCSGGLIAPDRVLTAGHCVWDDRDTQGPFEDLAFAPAQWKKDGKITAPLGKVDWDYVTLFEAYVNDPDGDGLAYDVAVITLSKAVGQQLGYLGIRADPSPCVPEAMALTLAGYPGDDPDFPIPGGWQGGCFFDVCQVNFSCSVSITNHTCDSYVGQSGAPMYDKQNYVRAVHTLGVLPGFSTSNGAITIQKFILDNVMGYWKETNGFSSLAPGSVGTGSYY